MNLVHEEEGALAHLAALLRRVEDFAQIRHSGEDGRQRFENEIGSLRQKPGDRGLAAARRAPKDHRAQLAVRHHSADRTLSSEKVVLTDHFRQAARTQPIGQRMRRLAFE